MLLATRRESFLHQRNWCSERRGFLAWCVIWLPFQLFHGCLSIYSLLFGVFGLVVMCIHTFVLERKKCNIDYFDKKVIFTSFFTIMLTEQDVANNNLHKPAIKHHAQTSHNSKTQNQNSTTQSRNPCSHSTPHVNKENSVKDTCPSPAVGWKHERATSTTSRSLPRAFSRTALR